MVRLQYRFALRAEWRGGTCQSLTLTFALLSAVFISLHSFSKSYAIPGHRLGAIIAHSSLLIYDEEDAEGKRRTRFGSLAKSLDNLQICPPRTDTQRAVAKSIADEEQQGWRLSVANDLLKRRTKFFASLKDRISWKEVARQLNIEQETLSNLGIEVNDKTTSPRDVGWRDLSSGGYYTYVEHPFQDTSSELVARGLAALVGVLVLPGSFFRPVAEAQSDRDLRISIANVEASKLDTIAARLLLFHALWTRKGLGWGI
jgi:aspartate/methionine/tyrosine aminotransferase